MLADKEPVIIHTTSVLQYGTKEKSGDKCFENEGIADTSQAQGS